MGSYDAIPAGETRPWSSGILDCFQDCPVCILGIFWFGPAQYVYASNAEAADIEDFNSAFAKFCGLTCRKRTAPKVAPERTVKGPFRIPARK